MEGIRLIDLAKTVTQPSMHSYENIDRLIQMQEAYGGYKNINEIQAAPILTGIDRNCSMRTNIKVQETISRPSLKHFKVTDPDLKCLSLNPITRICINPQCTASSLICSDQNCTSCGNAYHLECLQVKLKNVTNTVNELGNMHQDLFEEMNSMEDVYMQIIRQAKKDFLLKTEHLHLSRDTVEIIHEIYQKKNLEALHGNNANYFYNDLKTKVEDARNAYKISISTYSEELQRLTNELIDLKQRIYNQFLQQDTTEQMPTLRGPHQALHSLEHQQETSNYTETIHRGLSILQSLNQEQRQLINKSLSSNRQLKELKLLYRGSQHQFSAKIFHQKCDSAENTFVLILTQFKKTIAGFSGYRWNSKQNEFVNDRQKKTFLLSLDRLQKYSPRNSQGLIMCYNGLGPVFGCGYDLCIVDECHKRQGSYAKIQTSYFIDKSNKPRKSSRGKELTGAKRENFKVAEYEVYEVIYT